MLNRLLFFWHNISYGNNLEFMKRVPFQNPSDTVTPYQWSQSTIKYQIPDPTRSSHPLSVVKTRFCYYILYLFSSNTTESDKKNVIWLTKYSPKGPNVIMHDPQIPDFGYPLRSDKTTIQKSQITILYNLEYEIIVRNAFVTKYIPSTPTTMCVPLYFGNYRQI